MNTDTQQQAVHCDRCSNPARESDVELAESFPSLRLSILCAACGHAEEEAEEARLTAQKRKREAAERESRLEIIPPEIRRTDIARSDFNPGLWLRVEGWRPSSAKWLGIVGTAGQCKTRCLALLAARLILDGHRLFWTTAVEFQERSDDLRSDERGTKAEASEYFKTCKRAGILVLDDLGKNTWTPTVERNLFSVIDHRKTHDLPVLWSANTHPLDILKSGELSRDRAAPLIGRILEASRIEKA
jgi:DNA replication protein DnaC